MPIFITLKHGEPIMARGYGMFWLIVRLVFFRWARVRMYQNDDYEIIRAGNVERLHALTDDDFQKRSAAMEKKGNAGGQGDKNPPPQKPRPIVPGGR